MDGTKSPTRAIGTLDEDARFAQLAAAAYDQAAAAKRAAADEGYAQFEAFSDARTGADCFLCWNGTEAVIVFRGTQCDLKDIVTDLDVRHEQLQGRHGIKVHRGFYEQYLAVHMQLADFLDGAEFERVVAVGHSLGGALAVLATFQGLAREAVTFGCPRVGDKAFATTMQGTGRPHRRYMLGADIVPWLPTLVMGYRHDAPSTYITANRRRVIRSASLWRQLLGVARATLTFRWASGWAVVPVPRRFFTDHRIKGYADALSRDADTVEEAPA